MLNENEMEFHRQLEAELGQTTETSVFDDKTGK